MKLLLVFVSALVLIAHGECAKEAPAAPGIGAEEEPKDCDVKEPTAGK